MSNDSLVAFRSALASEIAQYLTDEDCLRFVRARKGNVEKAVEMCNAWWIWYNKPMHIPDRGDVAPRFILQPVEDRKEGIYKALMPFSNFGKGKDGHPVYWEMTGLISSRMAEINELVSIEDMVTRHVRQQEMAIRRMQFYSKQIGRNVDSQIIVMNLANLSYRLDTKALTTFRQTLVIDQHYYPERLYKLFMINAPWFFTAMWAMIKPWIDPVTVEKFQILGSNYLPTLREYIDDDEIPEEFGGGKRDFPWQWPFPPVSGCSPEQLEVPLLNESFVTGTATSNDIRSSVPTIDTLEQRNSSASPPVPEPRPRASTIGSAGQVQFSKIQCRMLKIEEKDDHHVYRMLVSYDEKIVWQVVRRYSEFSALRAKIRRISSSDGHIHWPKVPPKSFFRRSRSVLSQRFLGLDLFVSGVINKLVRDCDRPILVGPDPASRASITAEKSSMCSPKIAALVKPLLLDFLEAVNRIPVEPGTPLPRSLRTQNTMNSNNMTANAPNSGVSAENMSSLSLVVNKSDENGFYSNLVQVIFSTNTLSLFIIAVWLYSEVDSLVTIFFMILLSYAIVLYSADEMLF